MKYAWLIGLALCALTGAGCKQFELSASCKSICDELRVCVDDDLSVTRCRDRCVDTLESDESDKLRHAAERCSDCIENNSCREIPYECRSCDEVLREFSDLRFEAPERGREDVESDAGSRRDTVDDEQDAGD